MNVYVYVLFCSVEEDDLVNKRVALFSYGSGLASTMFSLTICPDQALSPKFIKIIAQMEKVHLRLHQRVEIEPEEFGKILKKREDTHHLPDYLPSSSIDYLWPGTYYLTHVDKLYRRFYERKPKEANPLDRRCDFL